MNIVQGTNNPVELIDEDFDKIKRSIQSTIKQFEFTKSLEQDSELFSVVKYDTAIEFFNQVRENLSVIDLKTPEVLSSDTLPITSIDAFKLVTGLARFPVNGESVLNLDD